MGPSQKISVNIVGSDTLGDNLLANNPVVEFTLILNDSNRRMIYSKKYRGKLTDTLISKELENINVPSYLANTFETIIVNLDLVIFNNRLEKTQMVPIMEIEKSKLLTTYVEILGQSYPNSFNVNSNEEGNPNQNISLTLPLISESAMLQFCSNNGYDVNGGTLENLDDYAKKLLEYESLIKVTQLELDNLKTSGVRVLKNTLGIDKDEDEELIGIITQFIENISELNEKYRKLSSYGIIEGDDKTKYNLLNTSINSLERYLKMIE
jgi:hypothetical protein